MSGSFYSPQYGSWVEGRGYEKRLIVDHQGLRLPGTLVQEVRIRAGSRVPLHVHGSCTEVFYGREGAGVMSIGGERLTLSPGATILCQPGQVHDAFNASAKDWLYVVFKTNVVENDTRWV